MKFLTLLSAVLISAALVSADSPVATGTDAGKVPQLLSLINKLEHANPTDPTFVTEYASDLPKLAALHHDVADQFGEKQVRKLYGDDKGADKLIELVKGVQKEKRDVNETETEKKTKDAKANHGAEVNKGKQGAKQSAGHKKTNHGDEVNKGKQGAKQSAGHKKPNHGDEVNKGKQGEKQSTAHKNTHAATGHKKVEHTQKPADEISERAEPKEEKPEAKHPKESTHKKQHEKKPATKPTHKEHKKPAHKHKSKVAPKTTSP